MGCSLPLCAGLPCPHRYDGSCPNFFDAHCHGNKRKATPSCCHLQGYRHDCGCGDVPLIQTGSSYQTHARSDHKYADTWSMPCVDTLALWSHWLLWRWLPVDLACRLIDCSFFKPHGARGCSYVLESKIVRPNARSKQ